MPAPSTISLFSWHTLGSKGEETKTSFLLSLISKKISERQVTRVIPFWFFFFVKGLTILFLLSFTVCTVCVCVYACTHTHTHARSRERERGREERKRQKRAHTACRSLIQIPTFALHIVGLQKLFNGKGIVHRLPQGTLKLCSGRRAKGLVNSVI